MVTVTEATSRAELVEAMNHLNREAMALSRRGIHGTHSPRYDDLHNNLSLLVTEWERATS